MLAALEGELPARVRWTRPSEGMFLWLSLPAGPDASWLLELALVQGIHFVPGVRLHPRGDGVNTLRLNFAHGDPCRIAEGFLARARGSGIYRIRAMTIGWIECLIILGLVALVAAVAFRAGYFRGKGR